MPRANGKEQEERYKGMWVAGASLAEIRIDTFLVQ
jgi:hypothetical protein